MGDAHTMDKRFCHLHLHTTHSLLDGFTKIPELVKSVKEMGMDAVAVTDHGNISARGMGSPNEGVLVETAGKRARIYDNPSFRDEARSQFPATLTWPGIGLPPDRYVLLPSGLGAFTSEGKEVVSHGGIALEEVVVPFVRLNKDNT